MKLADIKPGMVLAAPCKRIKWAAVQGGHVAIPSIVIGVGKYRLGKFTVCGVAAIEDEWASKRSVVVMRPETDHYGRMKPINSDTKWELAIVNASQVMAWDAFAVRRQEQEIIAMDIEALTNQSNELVAKRMEVLRADPGILAAALSMFESPPNRRHNEYFRVEPAGYAFFNVSAGFSILRLSQETQDAVAALTVKIEAIQAKLACAR